MSTKEVEEYNSIENDPLAFSNRNPPLEFCNHGPESACGYCNLHFFEPTKEQSKMSSSVTIGRKLLECKKKYYSGGKSPLSDAEYDSLESSLRTIDPDNPILKYVGTES